MKATGGNRDFSSSCCWVHTELLLQPCSWKPLEPIVCRQQGNSAYIKLFLQENFEKMKETYWQILRHSVEDGNCMDKEFNKEKWHSSLTSGYNLFPPSYSELLGWLWCFLTLELHPFFQGPQNTAISKNIQTAIQSNRCSTCTNRKMCDSWLPLQDIYHGADVGLLIGVYFWLVASNRCYQQLSDVISPCSCTTSFHLPYLAPYLQDEAKYARHG